MKQLLFHSFILPYFLFGSSYAQTKDQKDNLATIHTNSSKIIILGKKHDESVGFFKVNNEQVGDYNRWPKKVKVQSGQVTLELRHFKSWVNDNASMGNQGGRINAMGVIENLKHMVHHHYVLTFDVEKGKEYQIEARTSVNDIENPLIKVSDLKTKKSIVFEVEKKLVKDVLKRKKSQPIDVSGIAILDLYHNIPNTTEKVSQIEIKGNAFSKYCSFNQLMAQAVEKARKIKANIIRVIEKKPPNQFRSCFKVKVEFHKFNGNIDNLPQYYLEVPRMRYQAKAY